MWISTVNTEIPSHEISLSPSTILNNPPEPSSLVLSSFILVARIGGVYYDREMGLAEFHFPCLLFMATSQSPHQNWWLVVEEFSQATLSSLWITSRRNVWYGNGPLEDLHSTRQFNSYLGQAIDFGVMKSPFPISRWWNDSRTKTTDIRLLKIPILMRKAICTVCQWDAYAFFIILIGKISWWTTPFFLGCSIVREHNIHNTLSTCRKQLLTHLNELKWSFKTYQNVPNHQ